MHRFEHSVGTPAMHTGVIRSGQPYLMQGGRAGDCSDAKHLDPDIQILVQSINVWILMASYEVI